MSKELINILLIDDHRTTNILNKLLLKKIPEVGQVYTAKSIVEASAYSNFKKIDIVLIDSGLVMNNSIILIEKLKKMNNKDAFYVLLSSNHLSIAREIQLKETLDIPEIKFKILTKQTALDIIESHRHMILPQKYTPIFKIK